MAVALPFILMAAGSGIQGMQQQNALRNNATTYAQEGSIASAQGYEAEAQQRRKTSQILGAEVAGAGQAGAGYQGSTGRMIGQSATNAELDALNIRYKSQLQKWAYTTQASNLQQESQTAGTNSFFKAGASLLTGYANYKNPDLG